MRALIIEDNSDIAECIVQCLADIGITSDWFQQGKFLKSALSVADYNIIVLDLSLPDMDGLDALREIRNDGISTPILIISARISVEERISGLDLGADDYLVKPFALDEFEARVRALLRRKFASSSPTIALGDLIFDQITREFLFKKEHIDLSGRERAVLEILMQKNGQVVSKERLAENIFNFNDEADISSIEIYIHRLRKKLSHCNIKITTRRGLGYVLEAHSEL
jgi:two-component system response regulator TctD